MYLYKYVNGEKEVTRELSFERIMDILVHLYPHTAEEIERRIRKGEIFSYVNGPARTTIQYTPFSNESPRGDDDVVPAEEEL